MYVKGLIVSSQFTTDVAMLSASEWFHKQTNTHTILFIVLVDNVD